MSGKVHLKLLATVAGGVMLAALGASSMVSAAQPAASGFTVTSTTFADGGALPIRTGFTAGEANGQCVGQNVSPQLSWRNPPDGTKSYAIVMIDAENMVGDIGVVVYGIPPNITSVAEGELTKPPAGKYVMGQGSRDIPAWRGQCPPLGTAPHHYIFLVMATNLEPNALRPGLHWLDYDTYIRTGRHLIDSQAIVGTFKRPATP